MASTTGVKSQGIKLSYADIPTGSQTPSYSELINLQEIPDLGQAPESIDTTCLADTGRHSIPGLVDYGTLEFTFLYDATVYNTLYGFASSNTKKLWQIELPDKTGTGANAKGSTFTWQGIPSVALSGAGVNGAMQFKLSISVSSDMVFAQPTA